MRHLVAAATPARLINRPLPVPAYSVRGGGGSITTALTPATKPVTSLKLGQTAGTRMRSGAKTVSWLLKKAGLSSGETANNVRWIISRSVTTGTVTAVLG